MQGDFFNDPNYMKLNATSNGGFTQDNESLAAAIVDQLNIDYWNVGETSMTGAEPLTDQEIDRLRLTMVSAAKTDLLTLGYNLIFDGHSFTYSLVKEEDVEEEGVVEQTPESEDPNVEVNVINAETVTPTGLGGYSSGGGGRPPSKPKSKAGSAVQKSKDFFDRLFENEELKNVFLMLGGTFLVGYVAYATGNYLAKRRSLTGDDKSRFIMISSAIGLAIGGYATSKYLED